METLTQFIKDYGSILTAIITPFALWQLAKLYQERKEKRDAKMNLFLRLMALRRKNPQIPEWADCLNQIDVVFQDDKSVRSAWRSYHDSLYPQSQHFQNQQSFQLDLLSEIASTLKYKDLKQTEIDRYYSPIGFAQDKIVVDALYRENIRVLSHSKSLTEAFSEEERKAYLETLPKE